MIKSMVFPDNNNLFNVTTPHLNENVAKLIQQGHDLGSSSSSSQDYILNPLSSTSSSSSSSHIKPSQQPHFSQHQTHSQQRQQQQPLHQQQHQQPQHPSPQVRRQSSSLPQQQTHQHQYSQPPQHQSPQVAPSPQQQNMHFPMVVSPIIVGNLSAPSSPPYPTIKTEEGLHQHNIDYQFMYSFDMPPTPQQQSHILPSQRSPHALSSQHQQRMLPYGQQSQQQQIRLQQQQQYQQYHHSQQQQQQLLYDSISTTPGRPAITSAMSMSMPLSVSIPTTSGPPPLMINPSTATSGSPFTPTGASASIPVFSAIHQTHTPQSNLAKDDASTHKPSTASMMASIQSQHQKRPHPSQSLPYSVSAGASADSDAAHPASPKRQRYDSGHQQHHALSQLSPSSIDTISDFSNPQSAIATAALSASTGATAVATTGTMAISTGITKRPRRSSTTSSRTSTGSYLDVTANPRPTKAIKATVSSAPVAPSSGIDTINRPATHAPSRTGRGPTMAAQITDTLHHHAFHAHQSHAQMQQLSQHVDYTHTHVQAHNYARLPNLTGAGNITHPRRAAQNRAAQRTFRNRRKAYIKDMEEKVLELNQTRSRFGMIQNENREIWGRYRTLENLIVSNGLQMPSFTPMTPFFETEAGIAAAASYAALSASSGQSGTANTGGATESNRRASQGSEIDGEGEDESNLLSHQGMNYKQSSSERSEEDGDDQDDDGEHELDQDLGAYTIHPSSSSFQRQQQQQRMDARVQDMEIRRP